MVTDIRAVIRIFAQFNPNRSSAYLQIECLYRARWLLFLSDGLIGMEMALKG